MRENEFSEKSAESRNDEITEHLNKKLSHKTTINKGVDDE